MSASGKTLGILVGVLALTAVTLGVGGAFAQQDQDPSDTGADPAALLVRLDELEAQLPDAPPPTEVELDDEDTWGTIAGDAGGVRAVLDTLEPELRRLFVDADDADGPVADAIALVARGWLDVWEGTDALLAWETHDLAFPIDASDDDATATGADELRGQAEKGLELLLLGRDRHLDGYVALRELGEAEPATQARLDARAAEAEAFDADVRPQVERLLSQPTANVLLPTDRFRSTAPGVEARARSMQVTCVDREAYAELAETLDEEQLAELRAATPQRDDCPALPGPADEVTDGSTSDADAA